MDTLVVLRARPRQVEDTLGQLLEVLLVVRNRMEGFDDAPPFEGAVGRLAPEFKALTAQGLRLPRFLTVEPERRIVRWRFGRSYYGTTFSCTLRACAYSGAASGLVIGDGTGAAPSSSLIEVCFAMEILLLLGAPFTPWDTSRVTIPL